MTTYDGSARWPWPIWVLCLGYSLLGLALAANTQWHFVPLPEFAAIWAGSALCLACALSCLLWAYLAVIRPLKKFQQRCYQGDALEGIFPARASGISGALNNCGSALVDRLIEVSDADLSDGVQAVKLRFSGDAAARLEALASSVEASEHWLRQRQGTLTELFTQVAAQAASAAQDVQGLAQAQRMQQGDVSRCIDETSLAVKGLKTLVHQWRDVDFKAAADAQKRLEINADALTDATAMLLSHADNARGATEILNQAARHVDHARGEFSGIMQSGTQSFEEAVQQLRAASGDVTEAAGQVSTFVTGGRQAIVRSLKTLLQSKAALEKAGGDFAAETQLLSAQVDALSRAGGDVESFMGTLRREVQQVAAQLGDEARNAIEGQMQALSQASTDHAAILAQESQSLTDFSDTIAMARSALEAMARALPALEGEAAKTIQDFADQLSPMQARLAPLEATLQSIAALEFDDAADALSALKEFTNALPDIQKELLSPQSSAILPRLETMQAALLAQLEETRTQTQDALAASQSNIGQVINAIEAIEPQPGFEISDIKDGVAAAIQAQGLSGMEAQLRTLETQLCEKLEATIDAQRASSGQQGEGRAALKAQLRKLSQDILKQNGDILGQLKHMRASQLQTLKQSVRAVPQAVSEQLEDGFRQDVKSMQVRLEGLITEALAEQKTAANTPPLVEGECAVEPDAAAEDLAGRLAAALETMEQIEAEVTALATAALAAPDTAGQTKAFSDTLKAAETALNAWGGGLENVATAIALARDAA